jgi:hypothetical protein
MPIDQAEKDLAEAEAKQDAAEAYKAGSWGCGTTLCLVLLWALLLLGASRS